ncbi:Ig-like domain-containing protein [Deinococcus sp. AJ005]|uniref:Ig-like domain-containing protein n=1 Tax=Deinococcus sp. AJ005 TaxID=2652443 RepID=UPI001CF7106D|nr:Ig-like domain-containing protein [Deinococcus sp. AJ005]
MFRRPATIALSLTASIAIVACNPTPAPTATVTNVAVSASPSTIAINATTTAKAVVTGTNSPAQTVTWTSSVPTVASVSGAGLVTGLKEGTTVITAKSTVDTSKSGSVTITVKAPASTTPVVTGVVLTLTPATAPVGGTATAKGVVSGTNQSQNVTFSSSNEAIAMVDDNGKITAKAVGTATIKVTSVDDTSKFDADTFTVTPATTLTTAKINFQTATAATPAGYTPNTGAAYVATSGIGWVTEATAGTATPTPLNLTNNARNRVPDGTNVIAGQDARLYTQIQMQCGTPTTGAPCTDPAVLTSGAFEYRVVNGKYNVTVSVGDADKRNLNSLHSINVEGAVAIAPFTPTLTSQFKSNTVAVTVTDGSLTIDAKNGKNTKLNYVDIVPAP